MRRLFFWIAVYRLANAWMIRTQFDPDEYWQTLEPAYCLVFGSSAEEDNGDDIITNRSHSATDDQRIHGCALTWEWTRRWTPPSSPSPSTNSMQCTSSATEKMSQTLQTLLQEALHGPIRSYVSILPTYWYYLVCRSLFRWAYVSDNVHYDNTTKYYSRIIHKYLKQTIRRNASYLISKGPAFLHAILIAAPTDISVWFIASRMNHMLYSTTTHQKMEGHNNYWTSWPFWALVCSITSWFHGYALVRTYANSVETVCLLVGIALLGPEIFGRYPSELDSGSNLRRCHRLPAKLAFVLGGLGACVRFTSLAAWIPLGVIVTLRSRSNYKISSSGDNDNTKMHYNMLLNTLIGLCATYGMLGVLLGCCIDRWFYGFWAVPFLGNIHFNIILGQGSLYGTHHFLWYAYAGFPAICGIMLPFFLWEFATTNKMTFSRVRKTLTRCNSKSNAKDECHDSGYSPQLALLGIIVPYIVLHSFSSHKEFRFLLPILPLICILAGHAIARMVKVAEDAATQSSEGCGYTMSGRCFPTLPKLLLVALILLNYPQLFYLGLIHQRGPIAVSRYLVSVIEKEDPPVYNQKKQLSIHYLMGCHSAPLYSHVHIPNVPVVAWQLDCSPNCRSNPDVVCESDAFSSDSLGFVMSAYGISGDDDCAEVNAAVKGPPSFLIIMQDDAVYAGKVLTEKLNMSHVVSIRHSVKHLSWHNQSDFSTHDVVTLFSLVDILFDHMEVYSSS